ncbi:MAG TPA: GbsR/MarR family transcriptional regulator [Pseudogracilibacillus sp.]|nr:GbsR/MarR family transcriptional regulator [Pseudogracilibacillus sp.]
MTAAKNEVLGAISETMDLYGVTPSAGTLYATLYLSDQMNLDEMRDQLNMSKPSMSTSVRNLHKKGMVKKRYQQGSRKHTYAAEKDFFKSFMSFYCQMWEREAEMNLESIEIAEEHLTEVIENEAFSIEFKNEAKEMFDLIENSKEYYHWLNRLANSVKTGEIFTFLPKENTKN